MYLNMKVARCLILVIVAGLLHGKEQQLDGHVMITTVLACVACFALICFNNR
jgi:hypothetical protein